MFGRCLLQSFSVQPSACRLFRTLLSTTTPQAEQRLSGKVAVITGAASGVGRSSAVLFARHGAKVVCVDLDEKGGKETVDLISKTNQEAIFVQADVSKAADAKNMISVSEKTFGAVNVLFNNAGISHAQDDTAETTAEDVLDLTMSVNVKGVFLGCKYGIPALRRSGGGVVINTASFVAFMGARTAQIAYTASKGAVLAMTRELACIHAKENIRVLALCPGPLRTELLMKYLNTEEKLQMRLNHIPLGRFGEVDEIAKAALFLASDDSSFMTGSPLLVDGGITSAYVT